ncbi:LPXTG cell wall anchor domain-containing protein [Aerococcaceae bacterium NML210727]|nr:LPXTG cell wall anchor domain-containing protein [Aerococcaceae bacterium NML210727]MCW6654714.1 LPXTG cell wall anchor domain-containing protein [Aerococcaceae bacterium NML201296]
MKKTLLFAAAFILVANAGAVFAEGAEGISNNPEVVLVVSPESNLDTEPVLVPDENEAKETETAEVVESEDAVNISIEVGEAQAESVEGTSLVSEAVAAAEPKEAVSESPTAGYSDELFSVFSKTVNIAEAKSKDENYTEDSRNNLFVVIYNANSIVGEAGGTGVLTDAILQQEIDKINLAISQLVLKEQPEAPKPEQPAPETPKPEQPAPETPKPEASTPENPKQEQPKVETPKAETTTDEVAPQPQAESNKPALPNTGNTEATAKPKDMTMEKPVSTTPATQSDNKHLPQTGETDSFAIFSAAALTILAGVGMLAYGKREEV